MTKKLGIELEIQKLSVILDMNAQRYCFFRTLWRTLWFADWLGCLIDYWYDECIDRLIALLFDGLPPFLIDWWTDCWFSFTHSLILSLLAIWSCSILDERHNPNFHSAHDQAFRGFILDPCRSDTWTWLLCETHNKLRTFSNHKIYTVKNHRRREFQNKAITK